MSSPWSVVSPGTHRPPTPDQSPQLRSALRKILAVHRQLPTALRVRQMRRIASQALRAK